LCSFIRKYARFFLYPMHFLRQPVELNSFGLRVWGDTVDRVYRPHRHNEIELNALAEGNFTYILAGRQVTVHAGEVALFWGAIPHQVIEFAPGTRLHWVTVPLDYVLGWELPRAFLHQLLAGTFFCDPQPLYGQAFFSRWAADLEVDQPAVTLLELRGMFFRFAQLPDAGSLAQGEWQRERKHGRAHIMAAFMSRHFQEPLTVAQIAQTVNLQPNYAMSIFKAAFGMSLLEYLTQQRIAHAQQLLLISDAPVTAVALDSGFLTLSHFYSAFGRLCGMSPGKYRAALRV
jgi:AraC family transcriptional regulator, melibiose operon regulatory protein